MGDAAMARGGVAGGPEAQVWWTSAKLTIGGPFLLDQPLRPSGARPTKEALGLISRRKNYCRESSCPLDMDAIG